MDWGLHPLPLFVHVLNGSPAPLWDFSQSIDSNPKITDPSHPYLVRTSGNTGTLSTKSNKSSGGHEVDLELAVLQQEVSAGREEVDLLLN